MKIFFDNCISAKLARAIHELIRPEHEAVALRDRFPEAIADTDWIPQLAREPGWIIISGDQRIRKRPQEREIWRAAKLTTFFMADGFTNVDGWEQVRWLIEKWPLIMDQARRVTAGSAFEVPRRGSKLSTL
ncbi:hypothetical protein PHYC_02409 [Phycisphaerales bacterium]|nr:hypothetical protein PHYC_02409 [Phycisphaerales bacterium]